MKILLLLSGPIASGKSLVAQDLMQSHEFQRVKTSGHLTKLAIQEGIDSDRYGLQELGDRLDLETDYRWVVDIAAQAIDAHPATDRWLLDSVRKERQVFHFRNKFEASIFHAHLYAPEDVLRARYENRRRTKDENALDNSYDDAILHTNEILSRDLLKIADIAIDTSRVCDREAAAEILSYLQRGKI